MEMLNNRKNHVIFNVLANIAMSKENTDSIELIKKSNNISDDKIMPGRKIKVWNQSFSILVDKSQNILILKYLDLIF